MPLEPSPLLAKREKKSSFLIFIILCLTSKTASSFILQRVPLLTQDSASLIKKTFHPETLRPRSLTLHVIDNNGSGNGGEKNQEQDPLFLQRGKSWVVLVDDEESIRLALGDYLYDSGYTVTACADAEAVLELLASIRIASEEIGADGSNDFWNSSSSNGNYQGEDIDNVMTKLPSAIISDIRMPGRGMNGLDLLSILKNPPPEKQKLKEIPVILLSAKAMTQDRIEGYKLGADAYLTKPFDPEELLSIIDNLIRRREQQSAANKLSARESDEQKKMRLLKEDMQNIKAILQRGNPGVAAARLDSRPNGSGKDNRALSLSKGTSLTKAGMNGTTTSIVKYESESNIKLTPSELQVLELLSKGYTNGEIAKARGSTSAVGVSRVISKLYSKTMTKTRTELVRWAIKTGYVSPR